MGGKLGESAEDAPALLLLLLLLQSLAAVTGTAGASDGVAVRSRSRECGGKRGVPTDEMAVAAVSERSMVVGEGDQDGADRCMACAYGAYGAYGAA